MATLIFGAVVLSLVLVVLNAFTKTNPRTVAVVLKAAGGVGALGGAALLGMRGRIDLAVTLGVVGLSLIYNILNFANFAQGDYLTVGGYIALIFVLLATWLGPKMISYWYTPPVPAGAGTMMSI